MAASLNKVMIIGNVGRDPEMRYTPGGKAVAQFTVAVNRRSPSPEGGEPREETEWFRIVAWERLAETCNQFLTKGSSVYIEGRLQTRSWEAPDGQKRYMTEVIAQTMQMLGSRPGAGGGQPGPRGEDTGGFPSDEMEPDDIPF